MAGNLRSISLLTGASAIQVGALALLSFALAKILPVEDFAITRLVTAYCLILTMLGHICLHDAVSAFAAAESDVERQRNYIATGAVLVFGVSVVVAFIAIAVVQFGDFWHGNLARALATVALFLPALTLAILFGAVLRAVGDLGNLNRYVLAAGLVPLAFIAPASALWGIDGWIAARVVASVAILAIAIFLTRTLVQIAVPRLEQARQLFSFARVQLGSGVLSMVMQSADVLFLERFGNDLKQVGIYALAALFTKSVMVLPESVGRVYFRKIAAPADGHGRNGPVVALLMVTTGACVALALFVAVVAPWIIRGVFGDEYQASIEVLYVLSLGIVPSGIWVALSTINVARKRPGDALRISATGVVTGLLALAALVPAQGPVGAAWAMNAANSAGAAMGLVLLFARRDRDVGV